MKTEKEFLEGIYRKAQERQEMAGQDHSLGKVPVYRRMRLAAAAAVAILVVPLSIYGVIGQQKQEKEQRMMPKQEADPAIYRMYVPSTNIFEGTVTRLQESEGGLLITAEPVREYRGEHIGTVTLAFKAEEGESEQTFSVGETVLVYVIEENGGYRINHTENGICRYLDIEDGYRVYENQYGEKVYTKELLSE